MVAMDSFFRRWRTTDVRTMGGWRATASPAQLRWLWSSRKRRRQPGRGVVVSLPDVASQSRPPHLARFGTVRSAVVIGWLGVTSASSWAQGEDAPC